MKRKDRAPAFAAIILAGMAPFSLCRCGRSDEAKALAAVQAKLPDGRRRCIGMGGLTGIKVGPTRSEVLFYPAAGPTSPLDHLFVFYAARSDAPVPETVTDLLRRGVLHEGTVTATSFAETDARGNPTTNLSVGASAGPYAHATTRFGVDIYETEPFDPRFAYALQTPGQTSWAPPNGFPSRVNDVPVTTTPVHWPMPTNEPYAISIVTAACLRETPERVTAIRVLDAADGGKFEEATVEWEQHPPAWMSSDGFRKAVLRPDTVWIDKPRVGTSILTLNDGQPTYVREKGFW